MGNVLNFNEMLHTQFIGPFERKAWAITVDGYRVPHIEALNVADGQLGLLLDGRYMVQCTEEEARRFLWFIANAMAVAAGYSAHGRHCTQLNPFQVRMGELPAEEPRS